MGQKYGGEQIMNVRTEQTILHVEPFILHIRGGDEIGKLQRILLKQQLATCVQNYILQSRHSRYTYYDHNEIIFLWK